MSLIDHNNTTILSKLTEKYVCVLLLRSCCHGNQNITNTLGAWYFVRGILYVYQVWNCYNQVWQSYEHVFKNHPNWSYLLSKGGGDTVSTEKVNMGKSYTCVDVQGTDEVGRD